MPSSSTCCECPLSLSLLFRMPWSSSCKRCVMFFMLLLDARRPDRFSQKEQNSTGRRPSTRPLSAGSERRSMARQIQSKRTEFVCPSSTRPLYAGSERRSMARQIQSKRTEFVCPSSTRPLYAGSERRSTARQIQSKRTEFVCPRRVTATDGLSAEIL